MLMFQQTTYYYSFDDRWIGIMRIIQRDVLESTGAPVVSGIRLWKA